MSLIADVDKPLTAVVGRDAVARAPRDPTQCVRGSRGDLANVLLLERPSRFDWVQVLVVRGQIQHADAVGPARRSDVGIVVGAQHATQRVPLSDRPPPGTTQCRWGWWTRVCPPRVEDGEEPDGGAQMAGVGCDRPQGLGGRSEQDGVDDRFVLQGDLGDRLGGR